MRYFAADFETTVWNNTDIQNETYVWSAAIGDLEDSSVHVYTNIDDFMNGLKKIGNCTVYFHNLKFDGSFIMWWLLEKQKCRNALIKTGSEYYQVKWKKREELASGDVQYTISDKGLWYRIIWKYRYSTITFLDSYKLMPFSLANIAKDFKTEHKKLELKYSGHYVPREPIKEEELPYIHNDIHVLREGINIMRADGHTKMTIGSCCMAEYKKIMNSSKKVLYAYEELFPFMRKEDYEYIRKAYRGGWCYLVKGAESIVYKNGITLDVNSLYPSMMHSMSGNIYPYGFPHYWKSDGIPQEAIGDDRYYFVRVRCRFEIKPGYLPFIQIKGGLLYKATEMLETSRFYDPKLDEYYDTMVIGGKKYTSRVELTLTMTDYKLLIDHYNVYDFEIIDGCWFYAMAGMFDEYIDKYKEIKMHAKGAVRQEAKLYLNNLYGKFATSDDSSFKVCFIRDSGELGFFSVPEHDKKPGYIPVGAAITSYARNFTIRAAQRNYHGIDKPGFRYADTDSIHCAGMSVDDVLGCDIHPSEFCHWSLECEWDMAKFVRQKTYMEHVKCEKPYWDMKCAGLPDRCKKLFLKSIGEDVELDEINMSKEMKEFIEKKRSIDDFDIGLEVPGKLMPKQVKGGTLLKEGWYKMR